MRDRRRSILCVGKWPPENVSRRIIFSGSKNSANADCPQIDNSRRFRSQCFVKMQFAACQVSLHLQFWAALLFNRDMQC